MLEGINKRPRGRPAGYRRPYGLEQAMRTFWARGFEAASVDGLCRAMNMPRASLYQLFGDKEGLFLAAIDHYGNTRIALVAQSLTSAGTLDGDLRAFFDSVISLATDDPETAGCLISCVLADAAGANRGFREELDRRYSALEALIATRLVHHGWPHDVRCTPQAAAGMVAAIARGITLKARSGHSRSSLFPVANAGIAALLRLADA